MTVTLRRLLLCCVLAFAGCDDTKPSTTPDTKSPEKDMLPDAPPGDTEVRDTVPDTTASDTLTDTPGGARKLGQGCCAPGASNCTLGDCESGLTCFVVSNGPYTDRGICSKACTNSPVDCACPSTMPGNLCPGGSPTCEQGQCMWLCLPGSQGCDSSQPCKCAGDLLCLGVGSKNMCLPKGG